MDLNAVAAVIEPHLPTRRWITPADHAASLAADLHDGGLLAGGPARSAQPLPVQERAGAVLGCRLDRPVADAIAAALHAAGLLRKEN